MGDLGKYGRAELLRQWLGVTFWVHRKLEALFEFLGQTSARQPWAVMAGAVALAFVAGSGCAPQQCTPRQPSWRQSAPAVTLAG